MKRGKSPQWKINSANGCTLCPHPNPEEFKMEQSVRAASLCVLSASAHAEKPNQRDTSEVHVILKRFNAVFNWIEAHYFSIQKGH